MVSVHIEHYRSATRQTAPTCRGSLSPSPRGPTGKSSVTERRRSAPASSRSADDVLQFQRKDSFGQGCSCSQVPQVRRTTEPHWEDARSSKGSHSARVCVRVRRPSLDRRRELKVRPTYMAVSLLASKKLLDHFRRDRP